MRALLGTNVNLHSISSSGDTPQASTPVVTTHTAPAYLHALAGADDGEVGALLGINVSLSSITNSGDNPHASTVYQSYIQTLIDEHATCIFCGLYCYLNPCRRPCLCLCLCLCPWLYRCVYVCRRSRTNTGRTRRYTCGGGDTDSVSVSPRHIGQHPR